ncbi:kit ligand b [Puntigrus tetrazona]|uniref:kit ligand b n=1 Tax=Puntigrus tetrazona TaxID=1606681 RepID=UPI001C89298D|nr:kit ligand b [Puntigrus tetrazona]
MFHMREVKIGESICVLVLLFSGLVTCSGVFGSPLTDDVATLETLSENIPSDYRIPIYFITKDVGGACWPNVNLYHVESSLKTLALKFGNLSTNKANITIFITMLEGFRITLDEEKLEVAMQTFECHYRRGKWPTRRYFNHVKEVLTAAGSKLGDFNNCTPPPCKTPPAPAFTPGKSRQQNGMSGAIHGLLALLIIPSMALLVLTVKMVFRKSHCCAQRMHEVSLNEAHDGAEESRTGPHDGAARGDPDSSSTSQQDRAWVDSLGCADTEV